MFWNSMRRTVHSEDELQSVCLCHDFTFDYLISVEFSIKINPCFACKIQENIFIEGN